MEVMKWSRIIQFKSAGFPLLILLDYISQSHAFQEQRSQTCALEIFEARCQPQRDILITHAEYGHIEISRCVDEMFASLGALGCNTTITDLISARCDGKSQCEVEGGDPEVVASKSCTQGLPMYMDIVYVCLPGHRSQTCAPETFDASCHHPKKIFIMQAEYGHIEVSRCVDEMFASFGTLGCNTTITRIIGVRCDGKLRCKISGTDQEVVASKSCAPGLSMYMDITYICLPGQRSQTCAIEVFEARCQQPRTISITQAEYGHIEVSRCVDEMFASLNTLGCNTTIIDIVGARCDGKSRCEISGGDSEVVSSKSCTQGLPMYMDITFVCVPETQPVLNCQSVSANRQLNYIITRDLWKNHCYDLDQSVSMDIRAAANLKLKISLEMVTDERGGSGASGAYLLNSEGGREAFEFNNGRAVREVEDSQASLIFTEENQLMIIGYQAFGCEDMDEPPYAWTTRNGDTTTIGCHHTDHEWTVTCIGSKWFGSKGNCTQKTQEVVVPTPPREKEENIGLPKKRQTWTPDILFALIIGLTVLLCAIVVTIGYVCLKRAKYTYASKSGPYEMSTLLSDPSNTATWQKAKLQGNNDTLILPMNAGNMQAQTLQLR